jgi:hypothetical protein
LPDYEAHALAIIVASLGSALRRALGACRRISA